MAKRMIELCDGNLQGIASTLNLLAYYNDIFGGALKPELGKSEPMYLTHQHPWARVPITGSRRRFLT